MTIVLLVPSASLAQENKIKTALSLRTHSQKIFQADLSLEEVEDNLSLARQALAEKRWEIVPGYVEQAREELKSFSHLFPSTAVREKLRQSLILYSDKKFAQAASILEQLSEELRWLGYYNDEEDLQSGVARAQQLLIKQKSDEFEKAILAIIEKAAVPVIDSAVVSLEANILLALAAWNRKDRESLEAQLDQAQKKVMQLETGVGMAQARHYISRSCKLVRERAKGNGIERGIKRAALYVSKCAQENPDDAAFKDLAAQTQAIRKKWGKEAGRNEEELAALLKEIDRLLAANTERDVH